MPNEAIKYAVHCEEDVAFSFSKKEDRLRTAVTLALLGARYAGQSSIIVVRTTKEAKHLYNYLNPSSTTQTFDTDAVESDINPSKKIVSGGIRAASTFARFKGNCFPSAMDCIIITSYDYLLRSMLHRKSDDANLNNKSILPSVSAYVFLDPLNEDFSQKRTGMPFTLTEIDAILFLFRDRPVNHVRKFFISGTTLPSSSLSVLFNINKVFTEKDIDPPAFDIEDLFENDLESYFRSTLPRMLLVRLYSGAPTKKELVYRLTDSPLYRLVTNTEPNTDDKNRWITIIEEELFPSTKSPGLFFQLQHELGPFALIGKAGTSNGRYSLTSFGKSFLFASTYFHIIANNPLWVIQNIWSKTINDEVSWDTTVEIFENYSFGKIRFDDLRVLLGELETEPKKKRKKLAELLGDQKKSYALFKVSKLLECFQEHMLEEARNNFESLSKASRSHSRDAEPVIGEKDRVAIEQAVREELLNSPIPLTIADIALNLVLQKKAVRAAVNRLMKDNLEKVAVHTVKPPVGRRVSYYSTDGFPEHFFKQCGDCHWYKKRRCLFWRRVNNIAERKIPQELTERAINSLNKKTVACELFLPSETMTFNIPIDQFAPLIPKHFVGFSDEGEELFEHFCPFCYKQGEKVHIVDFGNRSEPTQGSIAIFCPRCNTSFKLFQKRSNKPNNGE